MKKLAKYEEKLLACVPEKWAAFYKAAPKEFKHDFIEKGGYTRDEFLEHAKATRLFDYVFYEDDPSDFVYKEFQYVPTACESWLLTEKEMELYHAMPDKFTQDEFRSKRLAMKMPISSQDKMAVGTLFKHIPVEGERYYDLEKGMIRPTLNGL